MSEKFTPGDWELIDDYIRAPGIFEQSDQMADYRGSIICDMSAGLGHRLDHTAREHAKEETLANAALISAAPNMYETLASIENDDGSIPKAIWDMRNAALAKARGES